MSETAVIDFRTWFISIIPSTLYITVWWFGTQSRAVFNALSAISDRRSFLS